MARRIDYEKSDLSVRGAVYALAGLSAALIVISVAIWLLEGRLTDTDTSPPVATVTMPAGPDRPRLQHTPAEDMEALRAETRRILSTSAWQDRKAGIARVPIERAMDELAKRGWPEGAP